MFYIKKIVSSVVDSNGVDVPGTSFEHYEVVDGNSGRVIGISENIETAIAILEKEKIKDSLNAIR